MKVYTVVLCVPYEGQPAYGLFSSLDLAVNSITPEFLKEVEYFGDVHVVESSLDKGISHFTSQVYERRFTPKGELIND